MRSSSNRSGKVLYIYRKYVCSCNIPILKEYQTVQTFIKEQTKPRKFTQRNEYALLNSGSYILLMKQLAKEMQILNRYWFGVILWNSEFDCTYNVCISTPVFIQVYISSMTFVTRRTTTLCELARRVAGHGIVLKQWNYPTLAHAQTDMYYFIGDWSWRSVWNLNQPPLLEKSTKTSLDIAMTETQVDVSTKKDLKCSIF